MEFLDSLKSTTIPFEVVLGGPLTNLQVRPFLERYSFLKYIHTSDIPPAQIYEATRRFCRGELIHWSCDDSDYSNISLEKVYNFYKTLPPKSALSIKTVENCQNTDLDEHRFFGFNRESPLMCPLGVVSRDYIEKLGGFDRRFLCGQWENSAICRIYEDGGNVYKYEEGYIAIEHLKKHGKKSIFWKGYEGDRRILEDTWAIGPKPIPPVADLMYGAKITMNGLKPPTVEWPRWLDTRKVSKKSQTGFFPYSDKDLLTISQCPRSWPPSEDI
jgi:hypothetical protein